MGMERSFGSSSNKSMASQLQSKLLTKPDQASCSMQHAAWNNASAMDTCSQTYPIRQSQPECPAWRHMQATPDRKPTQSSDNLPHRNDVNVRPNLLQSTATNFLPKEVYGETRSATWCHPTGDGRSLQSTLFANLPHVGGTVNFPTSSQPAIIDTCKVSCLTRQIWVPSDAPASMRGGWRTLVRWNRVPAYAVQLPLH
jgi:hypothetical protein